jgi:hypothetical protein
MTSPFQISPCWRCGENVIRSGNQRFEPEPSTDATALWDLRAGENGPYAVPAERGDVFKLDPTANLDGRVYYRLHSARCDQIMAVRKASAGKE